MACWGLAGDSVSQLPPGTERGLRAPSCRLGPEIQNRGGIHTSSNKLHSADRPEASWCCCCACLFEREMGTLKQLRKQFTIMVIRFNVQLGIYLFLYMFKSKCVKTVIARHSAKGDFLVSLNCFFAHCYKPLLSTITQNINKQNKLASRRDAGLHAACIVYISEQASRLEKKTWKSCAKIKTHADAQTQLLWNGCLCPACVNGPLAELAPLQCSSTEDGGNYWHRFHACVQKQSVAPSTVQLVCAQFIGEGGLYSEYWEIFFVWFLQHHLLRSGGIVPWELFEP